MTLSQTIYQALSLFLVYSFLGWCVEVIYCTIVSGKMQNRGFLNGPVCPIYGFGMLGILVLLHPFIEQDNGLLLFLGATAITTSIEFFGGWALYHLFHARWWDYSDRLFNIGGYICLQFSLIWGISTLAVIDVIHPMVEFVISFPPLFLRWALVILFCCLMLADTVVSVLSAHGLSKQLEELEKITRELHAVSDKLSTVLGEGALKADQRLDERQLQLLLAKAEGQQKLDELRQRAAQLAQQRKNALLQASQNLQLRTDPLLKHFNADALSELRAHLRNRS